MILHSLLFVVCHVLSRETDFKKIGEVMFRLLVKWGLQLTTYAKNKFATLSFGVDRPLLNNFVR